LTCFCRILNFVFFFIFFVRTFVFFFFIILFVIIVYPKIFIFFFIKTFIFRLSRIFKTFVFFLQTDRHVVGEPITNTSGESRILEIEQIKATRIMNAATRRAPFQKKIGAGLTVNEFKERIEKKIITGHVGLTQSIAMIANVLKWKLDKIEVDPVEPVIAETQVESEAVKVEPGQVAGLRQCARGIKEEKELISLDFQAYIGAKEEYDAITIKGVPNVHEKIAPCIHGDSGTVAIIVNSIPKVMNAAPGLVTMKDLPVPSAALEDMRNYFG